MKEPKMSGARANELTRQGRWTEFGLRDLPALSARRQSDRFPQLVPEVRAMVEEARQSLQRPLIGITTDGIIEPRSYSLESSAAGTTLLTDAASRFIDSLGGTERAMILFPIDADERRLWFNTHPNVLRHGIILEALDEAHRRLAMDVLKAALSTRGFTQARDIMRLNDLLVDITGRADDFGEWAYFMSFFNTPSRSEPWAFQIDGHHLNVNVTVVRDHLVITPTFMGSEPCDAYEGRLAETSVFVLEQMAGSALRRSLSEEQAEKAVRYPSIMSADIPIELQHRVNGRMVASAFRDNAIVPHEGIRAAELSEAQLDLLRALIGTYVGWAPDEHASIQMSEIEDRLEDTYFSWMGTASEVGPFYYRVHSPVVLIEFDHHRGTIFANPEPSRNHIHTIMRTPNGGDYGIDLLRQHLQHHAHVDGQRVSSQRSRQGRVRRAEPD